LKAIKCGNHHHPDTDENPNEQKRVSLQRTKNLKEERGLLRGRGKASDRTV